MDLTLHVNRTDLCLEKKLLTEENKQGLQREACQGTCDVCSSRGFCRKPFTGEVLEAGRASSHFNEVTPSLSSDLCFCLVVMENGQMKPRKNLKENLTKLKL